MTKARAPASALQEFKDGVGKELIATDITARGLDIDKFPYVVNFDLPQTR